MERYLELTVNREGKVGEILRRQAGLTKKQISQIKFRPGGIQKNGIQCRVTENAVCGDVIRICLETRGTDSAQLKTPKFLQIQAEETKKRNDTSDGYADFGVECRGKNESISDLRSDSKKECSEGKNAVSNFKCGFPDLEILYEDQDVLAVNKPAGMVTHPSGIHYQDSLSNQIAEYFRSKGEETRIRSIGRLDKETSGILLFARNQISAARLQKQREEGKLQKTYLAVVERTFEEEISQSSSQEMSVSRKREVGENFHPSCPRSGESPKMVLSPAGTIHGSKKAVTYYQVPEKLCERLTCPASPGNRAHPPDPCAHGRHRSSPSWRYLVQRKPNRESICSRKSFYKSSTSRMEAKILPPVYGK